MTTNKDIVETAKSYIGKLKYVFGGDNIAGGVGDCSDFTQHVFAVHGFEIGYDTQSQYQKGIPVSRDSIQAGHLVFFKNTYNSGKIDGVSHVGIAVDNNHFVHLSNDGCMISNLNENYWKEHYLDARRINGVTYEDGITFNEEVTETLEHTGVLNSPKIADITRVVIICLLLLAGAVLSVLSVGNSIKTKGVL